MNASVTSGVPPPSPARGHEQQLGQVLTQAAGRASAAGRADLVGRLAIARNRLTTQKVTAAVVGEFKQGKSSLLNALLNVSICPVDEDLATAVPMLLHFAAEPQARLWRAAKDGHRREEVPVSELAPLVSRADRGGAVDAIVRMDVGLPRRLLAEGLVLVDTPGVGGAGSRQATGTVDVVAQSQALLFVSDASQELTASELGFLRSARELCPAVIFVLTKVDMYWSWREVMHRDQELLAAAGIGVPVVAVSAVLRQQAVDAGDSVLNEESGFPRLVALLRTGVIAGAARLLLRSAAADTDGVLAELRAVHLARRSCLADPKRAGELLAGLNRAKEAVLALRDGTARWQTALYDGVADMSAEADFELRSRTRAVVSEAEDAIDEGDPTPHWAEIIEWLTDRTSAEVTCVYSLLIRRARALAGHASELLHVAAPSLGISIPASLLDGIDPAGRPDEHTSGSVAHGLTALRGAYGGVAMLSTFARMAGLLVPTPLNLAWALLMGGQGFSVERQRVLMQRRAQAKAIIRRYIDEVTFQIGKDTRDALKVVQRTLRDTCLERVDQMQRTANEALQAAQQAMQTDAADRAGGLRVIDAELSSILQLRSQLAPVLEAPVTRSRETES
jgi:Dynamin family